MMKLPFAVGFLLTNAVIFAQSPESGSTPPTTTAPAPRVLTHPFLSGSVSGPTGTPAAAQTRPTPTVKVPKVWHLRQVGGQGFSDSQSGHYGVMGTNSVFLSIKGEITGDSVTTTAISTAKGMASDTVTLTKSVHLSVTSDGHILADQSECSGDEDKAAVAASVWISVLDGDGRSRRTVVTFSSAASYKNKIQKTSHGLLLSESGKGAGLVKTSTAVFEAVQE